MYLFAWNVGHVVARSRRSIDSSSRDKSSREAEWCRLRGDLPLHGPRLDGDNKDLAGHDEGGESHGDGEGEHCIQFVVDHCVDNIPGLRWVSGRSSRSVESTYAQHEDQTARDQAEGRDNLGRWACWQVRCWRSDVQQDVRRPTSQSKSGQKVPPLPVDHSRHHAILMVRSHHHTQEEDHQRRHGVERHPLGVGDLPGTVR